MCLNVLTEILDYKAHSQILHLFCEHNSIHSVTRLLGATKNTVIKLLIDAGKACKACMVFHDANARDVKAKRVQVD
jgi:AhpD family alkylhydroperoxidase